MTTCGTCGGPLFRRTCYAKHKTQPRQAKRKGEGGGCYLRWQDEYTTNKGAILNVAVFRAYRTTPGGQVVRVWQPGERWPG